MKVMALEGGMRIVCGGGGRGAHPRLACLHPSLSGMYPSLHQVSDGGSLSFKRGQIPSKSRHQVGDAEWGVT